MVSYWSGPLNPSQAMLASLNPVAGPMIGTPRMFYDILDLYYRNNALYENLHAAAIAGGEVDPYILSLRNPAHQIVEFYAGKVWPGANLEEALPILTDNEAVKEAI